jgi:hypothetical protein
MPLGLILALLLSTGSMACASQRATQVYSSAPSLCHDTLVEVSVLGLAGEAEFNQMSSASLASDLQHGLQDSLRALGAPCLRSPLELSAAAGAGRFWVSSVLRSSGDNTVDTALSGLVSRLGPFKVIASGTAGSDVRITFRPAQRP